MVKVYTMYYWQETDLRYDGMLEEVFDFRYERKRRSVGSFSFSLSSEYPGSELILPDRILEFESGICGIVETIETDLKTGLIRVAGKTLEHVLSFMPAMPEGWDVDWQTGSYYVVGNSDYEDGELCVQMATKVSTPTSSNLTNIIRTAHNNNPFRYIDLTLPADLFGPNQTFEGYINWGYKSILELVQDIYNVSVSDSEFRVYVSQDASGYHLAFEGYNGVSHDSLIDFSNVEEATLIETNKDLIDYRIVTYKEETKILSDTYYFYGGTNADINDLIQGVSPFPYQRVEWKEYPDDLAVYNSSGTRKKPTVKQIFAACNKVANDSMNIGVLPRSYQVVLKSNSDKYSLGDRQLFLINKEPKYLTCSEVQVEAVGREYINIYSFIESVSQEVE